MKKTWIIGLTLFSIVFTACGNNSTSENTSCIEVKLIEALCGNAVLQVIDPNAFDKQLQDWTDGEGIVHANVFSTMLPCNVDESANEKGSQFYVQIIEEPEVGECMRCMAILANAPELAYHIKVVENCD